MFGCKKGGLSSTLQKGARDKKEEEKYFGEDAKDINSGNLTEIEKSITPELLQFFGGCLCGVGQNVWNPITDESSPTISLDYLCPKHSVPKNPLDVPI